MLYKILRQFLFLSLFFCSTSKAFNCATVEKLTSDNIDGLMLVSVELWTPRGVYIATIYSGGGGQPGEGYVYGLYSGQGGDKYCLGLSAYISQVRILNSCPDGVERALPCLEIAYYGGLDAPSKYAEPIDHEDGTCSVQLLVLAADQYGRYRDMVDTYTPRFTCADLDALPENGQISAGKLLLRNFHGTDLEPYYRIFPDLDAPRLFPPNSAPGLKNSTAPSNQ